MPAPKARVHSDVRVRRQSRLPCLAKRSKPQVFRLTYAPDAGCPPLLHGFNFVVFFALSKTRICSVILVVPKSVQVQRPVLLSQSSRSDSSSSEDEQPNALLHIDPIVDQVAQIITVKQVCNRSFWTPEVVGLSIFPQVAFQRRCHEGDMMRHNCVIK